MHHAHTNGLSLPEHAYVCVALFFSSSPVYTHRLPGAVLLLHGPHTVGKYQHGLRSGYTVLSAHTRLHPITAHLSGTAVIARNCDLSALCSLPYFAVLGLHLDWAGGMDVDG